MEDNETPTVNLHKRHSFSGRVWKHLRGSKKKEKADSFVSYCSNDDCEPRSSYISPPTNFQIQEFDRQLTSFSENVAIQACPFDVTGYGSLLMKDKFKLKKPKKIKVYVFLFEQIIIFTTVQRNDESYYYLGSIKINNLSIAPISHNKTKLLLKDFVNSKTYKNNFEYKLEAKTEEIQNTWRDALQKCLWKQLLNARDNHQNG